MLSSSEIAIVLDKDGEERGLDRGEGDEEEDEEDDEEDDGEDDDEEQEDNAGVCGDEGASLITSREDGGRPALHISQRVCMSGFRNVQRAHTQRELLPSALPAPQPALPPPLLCLPFLLPLLLLLLLSLLTLASDEVAIADGACCETAEGRD